MSTGKRRVFTREFKLAAVKRILAGEHAAKLSNELQIPAGQLYKWCRHFRRGGPDALRPACRPRKVYCVPELDAVGKAMRVQDVATARKRIVDLERKIGQQQVELDFFRQALRQVGEARRPSEGPGVSASTPSSRR
jgi:transposase-like protein